MTRYRFLSIVVALLATLSLAACGDDDNDTQLTQSGNQPETTEPDASDETDTDTDDQAVEASFPVTVSADNGDVTIEERPERIVSLSGTATEMLFAIDAGDQVEAVDSHSTYPDEAPVTDLQAFEASTEAVAELDPDLVVLAYDPGGVIDGLELLGIPAILFDAAADMDEVYSQIEVYGAATGNIGAAAELVGQMQTDLDEIVAELPDHVEGLTYFHELDDMYYTATSHTFIGQVYGLLGLENIADAADPDGESGGYPQLSEEYIIQADPDIIFLADGTCCGQSTETVAARPGWESIAAVDNGAVFVIDDAVSSRWGPRIIDFIADVAESVAALEPAS